MEIVTKASMSIFRNKSIRDKHVNIVENMTKFDGCELQTLEKQLSKAQYNQERASKYAASILPKVKLGIIQILDALLEELNNEINSQEFIADLQHLKQLAESVTTLDKATCKQWLGFYQIVNQHVEHMCLSDCIHVDCRGL